MMLQVVNETKTTTFEVERHRVVGLTITRLSDGKPAQLGTVRKVLDAWAELLRSGTLAPGLNAAVLLPGKLPTANEEQSQMEDSLSREFGRFAHLTDLGQTVLEETSRDPTNTGGYVAYLRTVLPAGSIALAYAEEAAQTFRADCRRASVVLVGAASESLLVDLRDALLAKYVAPKTPPKDLTSDRPKTFLDAIDLLVRPRPTRATMPGDLAERFSSHWGTLVHWARMARNDSGHPQTVASLDRADVHGILLGFSTAAKVTLDLTAWAASTFQP